MNRYYVYLILFNMFANMVAYIPKVLVNHRFDGLLQSITIGTLIGLVMMYIVSTTMFQFPGEGYPEIVKRFFSKKASTILLILWAIVWFLSGVITLIAFSFIAKRFFNPTMPVWGVLTLFCVIVAFGVLLNTKQLLYFIEIMMLLLFPFVLIIFLKAYFSNELDWQGIKIPLTMVNHWGDYSAISASYFSFVGCTNLLIFNRVFTKKHHFKKHYLLFFGLLGFLNLFTSAFIPIGIIGIDEIQKSVYLWWLSTDSLHFDYMPIERVSFVFVILYVAISLISVMITWHTGVEFLKSVWKIPSFKWKKKELPIPYFLVLFIGVSFSLYFIIRTEETLFALSGIFYNSLIPLTIFSLVVLLYLKKKGQQT